MRGLFVLGMVWASPAWAGPEQVVDTLLQQWRVAEAAERVEPLLAALPDLPAIQAAAARV